MEMWGRWCQFDDDSAFRVRVVGISGHGRADLPGPGLAISDKGGLCRVFSPAEPIFVVQATVVGTARQNISMVGCCRLPFGTASRSVRVLLKVPYLHSVPVVVPASRSEGALRRTRSTPSPDLAAGPPRRSPPRQSPLAGSSPSAASAMHKTTGRLLRFPHRTALPSSHFAADGQSARPSASFAPPAVDNVILISSVPPLFRSPRIGPRRLERIRFLRDRPPHSPSGD